jgi:hypothetical protein
MNNLDVGSVIRLHKLFSEKNWVDNLGQTEVHENFCKLLACMDSQEQELMLELVERYDWIPYNRYGELVKEMFDNLAKSMIPRGTIYLFPLKKAKDQLTTKSSDALLYMFQGFVQFLNPPFRQAKFILVEKLDKIAGDSFSLSDRDDFFLMDDFLGTGETLETAVREIQEKSKIPLRKITILALVAHQSAISLMNRMGIRHSVALIRNKGISDYYDEPQKEAKIISMKKIESNITTNKKLLFGYMGSEGLVTMIKTPNNTFPVFWMDYKFGEKKLAPPFPRFQMSKL